MNKILIFSVFFLATMSVAQETFSAKTPAATGEGISIANNETMGWQRKGAYAIFGSVIDQSSREPIANAKVTLLGTKSFTQTSEDGQYKIDSIAEGVYQIKAEAEGYESQILNNVFFGEGKATGFFTLQKKQQEPSDFVEVDKQPMPLITPPGLYPEIARRAGIQGTVWIKIWVDENGDPHKAVVLKSDSEILNQNSIDAAMNWKFKPAMLKGKPVAVWVSIPFKFKMDEVKKEPSKKKSD